MGPFKSRPIWSLEALLKGVLYWEADRENQRSLGRNVKRTSMLKRQGKIKIGKKSKNYDIEYPKSLNKSKKLNNKLEMV